jgi:leishmanolysin-like peptidase
MYAMADHSSICESNPSVLAYAGKCYTDQFDRPLVGYTNFCPRHVRTDEASYSGQLTTAVHEMAHALGFTRDNFAFMRFPNGTARTPRRPFSGYIFCVLWFHDNHTASIHFNVGN